MAQNINIIVIVIEVDINNILKTNTRTSRDVGTLLLEIVGCLGRPLLHLPFKGSTLLNILKVCFMGMARLKYVNLIRRLHQWTLVILVKEVKLVMLLNLVKLVKVVKLVE